MNRTAIVEILTASMRSLRAHGENDLASRTADVLLELANEPLGPVAPVTEASGLGAMPPNLQTIGTGELAAEIGRRCPAHLITYVGPADGHAQAQLAFYVTQDIIAALGLVERVRIRLHTVTRMQDARETGARPPGPPGAV